MTATIQPDEVQDLADLIGRKDFTQRMMLSPKREALDVRIRLSTDPKNWIAQELETQPDGERAIVFCPFKKNVFSMARLLRTTTTRSVFECESGKTDALDQFRMSQSSIMVCTSVLSAGVTFGKVTQVIFLDCAGGTAQFLQGAGRGARGAGEKCVATLVTSRTQLQYFAYSDMKEIAHMAEFCLHVLNKNLDFASELYKLFEHPQIPASSLRTGDVSYVTTIVALMSSDNVFIT